MVIETVRVSSRGQIVIPERLRESMGIEEGTTLVLVEKGKTIILEREENFLKDLEKAQTEKDAWLRLAEKGLEKVWNNAKDEKISTSVLKPQSLR